MTNRRTPQNSILLLLLSLSLLLVVDTPAQAETYIAGQLGATVPYDFLDYGTTDVMYGAKLGHYFDSRKWLGVETEVFHTYMGVSFLGLVPSASLRVTTWAPVNVVARYQMGKLEPYAGVGLGLFFASLKNDGTDASTSSTQPGLNTQLGLRYRVTNNWAVFGEWKFNYARFDFDPTIAASTGIDPDYIVNNFVLGLGYHF